MDFKTRASAARLHLHQLHPVNGLTIDVIRVLLHFLADTVTKTSQFDTRRIRDKFFLHGSFLHFYSTQVTHPMNDDKGSTIWRFLRSSLTGSFEDLFLFKLNH